uniref:Methyltransferase-like protein 17, mitochondrial n=2 Tax=Cacopsylla melanoneura TaxID=428564 RepID=A0A8D8TJL3_9HEMI
MSSILGSFIRRNVSKVVLVPQFEPKILDDIKNNIHKPRHHPGRRSQEVILAPKHVEEAIKIVISKGHTTNLKEDGDVMRKYLKARQLPPEKYEIVQNMHKFKEEFMAKIGLDDVDIEDTYNEEDIVILDRGVRNQVNKLLKQRTYNWEPINFTDYIARVYLWNRFVPEYAVLLKVLEEIQKQDPDFKPHSLFDFGSGVGTAVWATYSYWSTQINEFYCVDTSSQMLDLNSLIIQGGRPNKLPLIKNVTYRQFLPSSANLSAKYSLVISAYSLLELGFQRQRLETIANLWEKTEDFLIIVEHGSKSGYQVVQEARDYILSSNVKRPGSVHVFAPCPHEALCPKQSFAHHCNFDVKYENLTYSRGARDIRTETFCYVILRRGERKVTPPWPRIVHPVLVRTKHSVCKLCTPEGNIEQINFTNKKHGMIEHRCAKGSKWGDLLPITIHKEEVTVDDDGDNIVSDENENTDELSQQNSSVNSTQR